MAIPFAVLTPAEFQRQEHLKVDQRQAVAEQRFATLRVDGQVLTDLFRPRRPGAVTVTFLQGLPEDALVVNVVPNPYGDVLHPEFWLTVASMSYAPWQDGQDVTYADVAVAPV